MAIWPPDFCPLINTFQESPPDGTISSSMDIGPAKLRRRTTANTRPIAFRMFLKKDQVQSLDNFYLVETGGGVEPFDFIHPRTGIMHQARFTSPPQYANRSIGYDVNIGLEIMP